jgi:hypothetical protein
MHTSGDHSCRSKVQQFWSLERQTRTAMTPSACQSAISAQVVAVHLSAASWLSSIRPSATGHTTSCCSRLVITYCSHMHVVQVFRMCVLLSRDRLQG